MEMLARFLVGQPFNIFLVACLFFARYLYLKLYKKQMKGHVIFLVSGLAWLFYALWEWLIKIKTPEADIRVDLLLIWPVLLVLLIWAVISFLKND
jgi:hypothetical protein